MKVRDDLAAGEVKGGSSHWLNLAALALLVACGGGGDEPASTSSGSGKVRAAVVGAAGGAGGTGLRGGVRILSAV